MGRRSACEPRTPHATRRPTSGAGLCVRENAPNYPVPGRTEGGEGQQEARTEKTPTLSKREIFMVFSAAASSITGGPSSNTWRRNSFDWGRKGDRLRERRAGSTTG